MKNTALYALLRLQSCKKIGAKTARRLLAAVGSPELIFKEKKATLLKIPGIGPQLVYELYQPEARRKADEELRYLSKNRYRTLTLLDADYPKLLKHCSDGPIVLFTDGNLAWNTQRIIAIVGTRRGTASGRAFCNQLIEALAPFQPIIVSGFAYGVDICAHRAAISQQLPTIAILAHGMETLYPKSHKPYVETINNNGGFITEFFHYELPCREHFIKRNRIIAGITAATVVIESAAKGGALLTADFAHGYQREVFAVPGRPSDLYSSGCNQLIKNQKARMLTCVDDIARELMWNKANTPQQIPLPTQLTPNEKKLIVQMKTSGKIDLDSLAISTELPVQEVASLLIQLELQGHVRSLPGKLFEHVQH